MSLSRHCFHIFCTVSLDKLPFGFTTLLSIFVVPHCIKPIPKPPKFNRFLLFPLLLLFLLLLLTLLRVLVVEAASDIVGRDCFCLSTCFGLGLLARVCRFFDCFSCRCFWCRVISVWYEWLWQCDTFDCGDMLWWLLCLFFCLFACWWSSASL